MVKFFPVVFALLEQAFDALDTCLGETVSLWVNFSSDEENKDNKGIKNWQNVAHFSTIIIQLSIHIQKR